MSRFIRLLVLPVGVVLVASLARGGENDSIQNKLTAEEVADGWIQLFDGETLFGWKAGSEADWKVAEGVISVTSGKPGLLHTTSEFSDYVLKVDFRAPKETNSGIFLRTVAVPTSPTVDCYEVNIADPSVSPFPTGSLVGRKKGTVERFSTDWQTYEIRAHGKEVLDYTDPKPLGRGFIGLQFNTGKAEFRNIKLKPLGLKDLFNHKDLTGWRLYPGKPTVATVTKEGDLNVKIGSGQVESEEKFGDFALQTEVICNAKNVNSGIFFRCIPHDLMNGYECQIQNGYKNGDRTMPVDCGTGGIYRRQNARRVVSDDFRWFHMTLVANGLHMAAWVDGYPVSDWTDTRPPDKNPRNGSRTEPGTLAIQAHDKTTDLSLRFLRAAEMRPR
jgi:3-keto-disaccharide hydrolase